MARLDFGPRLRFLDGRLLPGWNAAMGRILVIGAAELIGDEVVKALGEETCIRASRSSDERVDISDPRSLEALFDRVGELSGIICTAGAVRFRLWDQTTDEDWASSLASKLLGQVNVVRYGAKRVKPGGAITLSLSAHYPAPGGALIATINAAVEAFVRWAAVEPAIPVRVNAVAPGWVEETLKAMGRDPAAGVPAADIAKVAVRQLREGASGSVALAAEAIVAPIATPTPLRPARVERKAPSLDGVSRFARAKR